MNVNGALHHAGILRAAVLGLQPWAGLGEPSQECPVRWRHGARVVVIWGGVATLGERGGALTLVSLADIDGCACAAASKNVTSVLGGSENPGRCPWRGTSGLASRVGRLGAGGGGSGARVPEVRNRVS